MKTFNVIRSIYKQVPTCGMDCISCRTLGLSVSFKEAKKALRLEMNSAFCVYNSDSRFDDVQQYLRKRNTLGIIHFYNDGCYYEVHFEVVEFPCADF